MPGVFCQFHNPVANDFLQLRNRKHRPWHVRIFIDTIHRVKPFLRHFFINPYAAQLALGNRRDARESAREAQRRNAYDERIRNVLSLLK